MTEKKIKIYLPLCFHRHTHTSTDRWRKRTLGTKAESNFAGLKENASLSKAKQVVMIN